MIIVDTALEKRYAEGNPVKVGMVGAGYMGRGITRTIEKYSRGLKLVALSNRTISKAKQAYQEVGIESVNTVTSVSQLENSIQNGRYAVMDDPLLLCEAEGIDVVIEATGELELGAEVTLKAIENRKHVVLMNAELDATVGPILKVYADRAGVVITNADGDQPGVMMNLYRFVKSIGYNPVLAGNIKGLQDYYRTPETQKKFAEANNISPKMATSFADGTKISMENAIVANATGFKVGKRGMYGPKCNHANDTVNLYPMDKLLNGGLVDYILGAQPGPGVFVLGYNDDLYRKPYMQYFKMGDGPLYVFYIPYHLPHLECHLTAARAVLFRDAAVAPIAGPVCDVIAIAKHNLKTGDIIDGIGGFHSYGMIENTGVARNENLLPMGLAEGCRIKKDIPKDTAVSFDDVEIPKGRICDRLWREQTEYYSL